MTFSQSMKERTSTLHPSFREAVGFAFVFQVALLLLGSLALDLGAIFYSVLAASAGFWALIAIFALRRAEQPTPIDLLFIRWGLPILSLICYLVFSWIGF